MSRGPLTTAILAGAACGLFLTEGLEALLFVVQGGLLALLYPTAVILTNAARQRPFELALVLMALVVDAIVLVVSVFIVLAVNAGTPEPHWIDPETARAAIRGSFIPLELFGLLFLVAYRRRWFRNGHTEDPS